MFRILRWLRQLIVWFPVIQLTNFFRIISSMWRSAVDAEKREKEQEFDFSDEDQL